MRYTIILLTLILFAFAAAAQEADREIGCAPLEVMFSAADSLQGYFWDFGDGTNSTIQNPNHNYTQVGSYTARLFNEQGGIEIGSILITVLPAVQASFSADVRFGCAPLVVNFANTSIIPNELSSDITFVWTFGDGPPSNDENPTHEYTNGGNFTVSLKVITADSSCDDIVIETRYIEIPELLEEPAFKPDKLAVCDPSEKFTFTVQVDEVPGATYTWDFGDGTSETGYGPISHIYADTGIYFVSLTVVDGFGCASTFNFPPSISIIEDKPWVRRLFGDTVCAGGYNTFGIASNGGEYLWSFDPSIEVINRQKQSPSALIEEFGNYTVLLRAGPLGCRIDTSFDFVASLPDAGFSVSPAYFCHVPTKLTFTANDQSLSEYIWGIDPTQDAPTIQMDVGSWTDDSFFIHMPLNIIHTLEVVDKFGCRAADTVYNIRHLPDAYFIPSVSRGCAPLRVNFRNISSSRTDIISNSWIFGDGQRQDVNSNDSPTHIYQDPGEYYARLIIENLDGCRDTSHAIKIIVGEEIDLDFTLDKTSICPGDSVFLSSVTMDERIDAWHFNTDDNQSSHCYTSSELNHTFFTSTGLMDVTLVADYNGCLSTITKPQILEVKGPIAQLDYMINCESPYQVMLNDQSQEALSATWKIRSNDVPSSGGEYIHTFTERGDYTIYLEASNPATGCPTSIDSVTVFIRDVMSEFSIAETYCAGDTILLKADLSLGVDNSCYKGYTWFLPGGGPRTTAKDSIEYIVNGRGNEQFILITEDINGCRDTLIKRADIYNIDANFELEEDSVICLQQALDITDLSTSDTTIVSWDWSFGSTEQNPEQIILSINDTLNNRIRIDLLVTDANGCSSSLSKYLDVYYPFTEVTIAPDTLLCAGEEIVFTATDYNDNGSFFNFLWNDGNGASSADSVFATSFDAAGDYTIELVATEAASGCIASFTTGVNVEENPVSDFRIPDELKCNDQILFKNLSTTSSDSTSIWIPGDGNSPISSVDLFHPYDVGMYTVTLITLTVNGCTDTVSKSLEIVAPEGDFFMSDSIICLGGKINLALKDTSDVVEFVWDFGDGITTENFNPISHIYNQIGTPRSTQVTLTLRTESGCETSVVKPLRLDGALANFGFELDSAICAAQFVDSSQSSSQQELAYSWTFFENGPTSNEMNPNYVYGAPGEYIVQQIIQTQDGNSVCRDTASKVVIFPDINNNIGIPNAFTPNNDSRNDYFNVVLLEGNLSLESVQVNEFKIFNRWGKLVYDNYDPERGWNGQVDGKDGPAEVYAYIVELTLKDGSSWSKKGNVTLLRGR